MNFVHKTSISITELFDMYSYEFHVNYALQDIRACFHAFENLFKHKHEFSCVICGTNPDCLIFDGNAKVRCSLNFNSGVDKNVEGLQEQVHLENFWKKNCINIVAKGLGVVDSYPLKFDLAPIMSSDVGKEFVYNTEFRKLNTVVDIATSGHREMYIEDVKALCTGAVTNSQLRSACREYGINVSGPLSNEDLRSLLLEHLEASQIASLPLNSSLPDMIKLFPSYTHTNGGLLTGSCKHGIVYYCKFLIRGEGARDVLDAVLSFKKVPKCIVYDDAARLADHARKRLSPEMYSELLGSLHGRVLADNEANISMAKQCLKDKRDYVLSKLPEDRCLFLYDRLHQCNSKKPNAVLRYMSLVKDLKGVNSQVAEELNSFLKRRMKTLNVMQPELLYNTLMRTLSHKNSVLNKTLQARRKRNYTISLDNIDDISDVA